ncbi:MAG: class I SAM-dependent methyltransferase [Tannerella sp.]|jgi:O-methyltransferase involved in polyketide biosynthesis|nr:class I SAM-dependent methyltransferase [Tannerella sp.]
METKDKIQLTEEKETLFIPLYGKALDYRSKNSVLNDSTANEIVEKVDADLTKHKRFGGRVVAVRAKQYDEWTKDFIAKNKNAVIVHLGCGLDARITRTQPPSSIAWFDVDYPEVIALRKRFYPETDAYKMIASSITAQNWHETIPADRPALIIAEGVFEYLSEEEVKTLLHRLTGYFQYGQIAFDVMNSVSISSRKEKLKKTTGAVNKWAVDDINEVDKLNAKLRRVEAIPLFNSVFIKELPFGHRFVFGLLRLSSKLKNGMRLLRYDF